MTKLRRLIEGELIGGLRPRRRRALVERLRGNAAPRRAWDRAISAFRVLEQREVSSFELDQVERWLFEDLIDDGVVAPAPRSGARRWTVWAAGLGTLASAAALLVWMDVGGPEWSEGPTGLEGETAGVIAGDTGGVIEGDTGGAELIARGGRAFTRPLALELACGQPARPARPARAQGCGLDELLGFSLRLDLDGLTPAAASSLGEAPLHLSLFGVDGSGELLYYFPTPADPEPDSEPDSGSGSSLVVRAGSGWQALPMSVRLEVNHGPGQVRVFALASDAPAELAQVQAWAAALAGEPVAGPDDPPWHLRLPSAAVAPVCARPERCASAETELLLTSPNATGADRP